MPATKKKPGRPSGDAKIKALTDEVKDLKEMVAALVRAQAMRTVETSDGPRKVEIPTLPAVPAPKPPPEPTKAVVFHSPHRNFQQRIIPGREIVKSNGETRLIPPVYVDFQPSGSVRVTDREHVKIMRQVKKDNDSRGIPTPWVEVSDEFADDIKPVEAIKHPEVDITSSLEDVQLTPGFTPSQLAGE